MPQTFKLTGVDRNNEATRLWLEIKRLGARRSLQGKTVDEAITTSTGGGPGSYVATVAEHGWIGFYVQFSLNGQDDQVDWKEIAVYGTEALFPQRFNVPEVVVIVEQAIVLAGAGDDATGEISLGEPSILTGYDRNAYTPDLNLENSPETQVRYIFRAEAAGGGSRMNWPQGYTAGVVPATMSHGVSLYFRLQSDLDEDTSRKVRVRCMVRYVPLSDHTIVPAT